jgi:hypothetical protein
VVNASASNIQAGQTVEVDQQLAQKPTLCWVFIMLRGIRCTYLEDEYVGVINIGEQEANIIYLMGEDITEIYCRK